MSKNNAYSVSLQKIYFSNALTILSLFKDGTVFKLTGADEIHSDFISGGPFLLIFNNRGRIYGKFLIITDKEIIMEWNVEGFNKPNEIMTTVEITLQDQAENCVLTLNHKFIIDEGAAMAKQRAWMGILDQVEKMLAGKR